MKILHLLSNWKWTERAEPAVDLALAQAVKVQDVAFACDRPPPGDDWNVAAMARKKGLSTVHTLDLPKHMDVARLVGQVRGLRRLIELMAPDIVHCHMPNAHLLSAWARGGRQSPALVRSCYEPDGPEAGLRSAWLYRRRTDGAVFLSQGAVRACAVRFALPPTRLCVAEPAVDLARFSPDRSVADLRAGLGIAPDDFVVGVVSRIRESRRLDVPIGAVANLAPGFPRLRLLVVGRGTGSAEEDVVRAPARRAGVGDRVLLAGYCTGDRLVAAYRTMNVLAYPMPGTDKSCRTVREAMAAGLPVLASRVGFLPELVQDGVNGRLTELSAESLALALTDLIRSPVRVKAMAREALSAARQRFDPGVQANKVIALYREILKVPPTGPGG